MREFNVEDVFPYPLQFTWKKSDPETGVPTDEDHTEIIFPKNSTSVPCSKVLSLNRSAPFAMTCAVADPSLLPAGVSAEVGTFEMGPIAKTQVRPFSASSSHRSALSAHVRPSLAHGLKCI